MIHTFLLRFLTFFAMGSKPLASAAGVGGTEPFADASAPFPFTCISIDGLALSSPAAAAAPFSFLPSLGPLRFRPRFSWSPFRTGDGDVGAPGTCRRWTRPGAGLRL